MKIKLVKLGGLGKCFREVSGRSGNKGKIVFIILNFIILPNLLSGKVNVVLLPDNVKVNEDAAKETIVKNMSEVDIYKCHFICIIDDYIYLSNDESSEVIKFSLKGEIIARVGRMGQGPGEFIGPGDLSKFNENIAIVDAYKAVICNKNLDILKEIKLNDRFVNLILARNNRIYFYYNSSFERYYFCIYTENFKFLGKFAKKITTPKENMKSQTWDGIRCVLYVPEENGIWASFRNRYDLRYYKDERLTIEIKSKKPIFSGNEREYMGKKFLVYTDYSVLLSKYNDELFYFYIKDDHFFCDIFKLSDNYQLRRRIKFLAIYRSLAHHEGYTFYGLRYDNEDKENVFLTRIEIHESGDGP
jgi:hypothetical protein